MINGQTLKKELSSIFRLPIVSRSLSLSPSLTPFPLPFSFSPSFLHFSCLSVIRCFAFVQGRTAVERQRAKMASKTDRRIYREVSFAGCTWQILNSFNRSNSSRSSLPSPRPSSPVFVRRWWIAVRKWKAALLIYRRPIIPRTIFG